MSNFNFTITWLHNRRQKDGNDGNREETTKQNDLLTQTKKMKVKIAIQYTVLTREQLTKLTVNDKLN